MQIILMWCGQDIKGSAMLTEDRTTVRDWWLAARFPADKGLGGRRYNAHSVNLYPKKTRMIVLPDAEDRTIVSSFFWTKYRNVTDGQTDRSAVAIAARPTVRIASNVDAL